MLRHKHHSRTGPSQKSHSNKRTPCAPITRPFATKKKPTPSHPTATTTISQSSSAIPNDTPSIQVKAVEKRKKQPSQQQQQQQQTADSTTTPPQSPPINTGSYFAQYARLDAPTTLNDTTLGSATTGIDFQPDQQVSAFDKSIKLGKHRAKRPLENAPTISKSLYINLQQGSLPTLIQQQEEFIDAVGGSNQQPEYALDNDDDFKNAYNLLVSNDLTDLNVRASNKGEKVKKNTTTKKANNNTSTKNKPQQPSPLDELNNTLGPTQNDISAAATAANWFPGHMKKALDDMAEKIKHVPITIEVRDARLPLSSANPLLDSLTSNKIKIIVLNKTDLLKDQQASLIKLSQVMGMAPQKLKLDKSLHPIVMKTKPKPLENQSVLDKQDIAKQNETQIDQWLNTLLALYPDLHSLPASLVSTPHIISENRRTAIIMTNNNSLDTTKSLLALVKALAPKKKFGSLPTSAIICGFPNVGKSTLINNLKTSARMTLGKDGLEQGRWSLGTVQNTVSKARAKIGPLPGVTRQVQGFKVSQIPPIVILDSPGIMVPRFDRTQAGIQTSYKLALVQCISDNIADPRSQCEHMLNILNQFPEKLYTRYYNIPMQTPIHDLALLFPFIIKKEEIQPQAITQWKEGVQKSRFGRPLTTREYNSVIYKSRLREKEANLHLGKLLNDYEKKKGTTVDLKNFGPDYLFPSKEEIHYEVSPEMEDLCLRAMLRAFRTGKLGKFLLD